MVSEAEELYYCNNTEKDVGTGIGTGREGRGNPIFTKQYNGR